ncbi:MAG: CPBP family intramembrane glutamic endopeptidase [Cytophagaceae bacterium]
MNKKHTEIVPFPIQLMNFIGVFAKAFGFVLLYNGIGIMVLSLLSDNPRQFDGLTDLQLADLKNAYISSQFVGAFAGLIILPVLYILFLNEDLKAIFRLRAGRPIPMIAFAIIIFIVILPLVNAMNEWNQSIHLPSAFGDLEKSLRDAEESIGKIINLIIYYDTPGQFLVIFLLVAIIPALGEELLFRGIVQNELLQIFRKPYIAILLSAFLFSFVHFQFFGFFPRMLLGALFGYLYYYSGNILIPVSLHCLNNGLTLINMNMLKERKTEIDLGSAEGLPVSVIIFSLVLSLVLLYIYRKISLRFRKEDERMAENI